MNALRQFESPSTKAGLDEEGFLALVHGQSGDQRSELVEGQAISMMNPASKVHSRIAANIERQLNTALQVARPDLDALREAPLAADSDPGTRPVADVAVVPLDATAEEGTNAYYFDRFFMPAEVISPSKTRAYFSQKKAFYASAAECLYVLILHRDDPCIEVWSRSNDWQGRVYRSMDDRIELLEFGFACRLGDLYRGTPIA